MAVELALALPVLMLVTLGGLVLGFMAYGRMALVQTADVAARELAGNPDSTKLLVPGQAYQYEGFLDSFGLPRGRVRAVALRMNAGQGGWWTGDTTESMVVVATCYRLPFSIPDFTPREKPKVEPLPSLPPLQDQYGFLQTPQELLEAERRYREIEQQVHEMRVRFALLEQEMKDMAANAEAVKAEMEHLAGKASSMNAEVALLRALGPSSPQGLEALLTDQLCAGARPGRTILTARAAYLAETSPVATITQSGAKGAGSQ